MEKRATVSSTAQKYIMIAVGVIIVFTLMASLYPDMVDNKRFCLLTKMQEMT